MKINFRQMRPSEKVILSVFGTLAILVVILVLFFWKMESSINQDLKKNEEEIANHFDQKFYELKKGLKVQQHKMHEDFNKHTEQFEEDFYGERDQLDNEFEEKKKAFMDNFKERRKAFELGREKMHQNFKKGMKEFNQMKEEFPQGARRRYKMPQQSASKTGSTQ